MLYFDNAATTKISKNSLDKYIEASEYFFNASSLYAPATQSKKLLEEARAYFVKFFKGKAGSTFIFTGSASESNNAVLSSSITRKDKKYIFSAGEHSSIYETAKHYKDLGYNVVFVPLNKNGSINEVLLMNELDDTVALVSIIHVSNETGAINDISSISKKIKAYNPKIIVHSDGVQAVGKFDINLNKLNVDYYTISAHKINGPKGVGALYVANKEKFRPFILGGGQEMNLRAGTENLSGILAFKQALEDLEFTNYSNHKQAILSNLSGEYVLVSDEDCVDNIISVCFKGVRGETIQHMLEAKDILIGTGSACNSKIKINRVLDPIVAKEYIEGAVRLSFGHDITIDDCEKVAKELSLSVSEYIGRIKK
ncbi:MAG: cysteine desulfurase [Clostridia bacterium]|nr:cysteine desulfurase [Clostridia bacterium]